MTSAPTLWAQALNAAGKPNSNISVLGNHQACFSNPNGYPVEAGFRFTLASMGSTNLAAKTFVWGPYAEGCVRQQTFMNLHPIAAGNYPITAYSRGSIDGQSDEIHHNATLHVG